MVIQETVGKISIHQDKSNKEIKKKYKFLIENKIKEINDKYSKFYDKKIFVEAGSLDFTETDNKFGYIFNFTINEPSSFKKKYNLERIRSFIVLRSRPIQKPKTKKKGILGGLITLTPSLDANYALYDPEWREYEIEYVCGIPGYFKSKPDWSFKDDREIEVKYTHSSAIDAFISFLKKHEKLLKMYALKEL